MRRANVNFVTPNANLAVMDRLVEQIKMLNKIQMLFASFFFKRRILLNQKKYNYNGQDFYLIKLVLGIYIIL